jgi:hypothetical protein
MSFDTSKCFADEAAIDFPSVGDLVARAREAFLGDGGLGDVVSADVWLSPEDAFTGAVVPIHVIVRETCAECGGRGERWPDACRACDGMGEWFRRQPIRLTVPPGVHDGARIRVRVPRALAAPARIDVRVAIAPPAA